MEIPINLNIIFSFFLFFAVSYFFSWLLTVKFWLVKIFAVIGGLKLLELALATGSYAIVISVILAYIVFFRESILRLFQGFLEWFYIIKDQIEALIRILLYPFLYAYKYVILNKESVDDFKQERQNQKAWDDVNQEKDKAHQSQQSSDKARRKAEQEKEYYKEQARKAREEAKKQEQNDNSETNSSNTQAKPDTLTPEQILGLHSGFTKADLKRAYRSLSGRYHPDKHKDMSEAFKIEAEIEFKKINEAYRKLLKTL